MPGLPFDVVVRLCPSSGARQNIHMSKNRVSLIAGDGAGGAKAENEYEVGYVYGAESSNQEICKRHVEPLIQKVLEGYNACVLTFGATGSGKTNTIEGTRARDSKSSFEGDGLVHYAIDSIFRLVNEKAIATGDVVAHQRRMPGSKAFDFFMESSFIEVYGETCHDLFQKGNAVRANLPIYEDDMEGYQLSSLSYRMSKNEQEMRTSFNLGRHMRDSQTADVGSVHERAAAIFTIHVYQYSPSAVIGEEDSVRVSRFSVVDMPGSERLTMDPELLRLREGPMLNKSLLGFASTISTLARDGTSLYVNYDECLLTKLLADVLGGNSMALMIGTLRPGSSPQDFQESSTTMQYLMMGKRVKNYPIVNHGRARALMQKLRHRLLSVLEDRETLRDQLNEVPADGDPNAMAVSIARLRDLEGRLNAEREEKAVINNEKQALQARLAKLRDAETGDLQERAELQDALIKSEEMRLALAKTLVDAQLDMNDRESQWASEKLELEKKVADIEGGHFEQYIKSNDYAQLTESRDDLNTQVLRAKDDLIRREGDISDLKRKLEEQNSEIRRLNEELNMIAPRGMSMDHVAPIVEERRGVPVSHLQAEAGDQESLDKKRNTLFSQLKSKTREAEELQSLLKEQQKEFDKQRNQKAVTKSNLDETREAYRRKLESALLNVSDMSRAVQIMQQDSKTGINVTQQDLFAAFQHLMDENLKVTEERELEMRQDLDEMHVRHVELKRKFRTLYLTYRQMRYMVEDKWPQGSGHPQPMISHEDEILGSALEDITRSEEEADRRVITKLRERTSHLDSQLRAMKVSEVAGENGLQHRSKNSIQALQPGDDGSSMYRYENEKLREELERLHKLGVVQSDGSSAPHRLQEENATLAAQIKILSSDASKIQLAETVAQLQAQVKAFQEGSNTSKSQAELERRVANAEAKKVMAEEQLDGMQKYLTQATVQYQREIVRLRTIIGQLDPRMLRSFNPLTGAQ